MIDIKLRKGAKGMYRLYKGMLALMLVIGIAGLSSCGGGGSSNDQGVSFTAEGFFIYDPEEELCQTGLSFLSVPIADNQGGFEGGFFGGAVFHSVQFRNNLVGQTVRLQGARLEYFIPNSPLQPPDTFAAAGGVMGPGPGILPGFGGITTLPPGASNSPNPLCTTLPIVPAELRQWLGLNKANLPEPPFNMVLTLTGVGVTSSGDSLDSNTLELGIVVDTNVEIPPTDGGGGDGSSAEGVDEGLQEGEGIDEGVDEEF